MKKLTFQRQILLGIVGLGFGHLLSWITSNRIFENLGWIFYGLLFVIHPVWPERKHQNPRIKTWIRVAGVLIILMGCMIRSGTGDDFVTSRISDSLGIDELKGTVVQTYDDHDGFHGDGTMYVVVSFEDDELEKAISVPGGWNALPLTNSLQTLIYGATSGTSTMGPYIGVTVPKIDRGYWFFYDRQSESYDDKDVLTRSSFNYTIAIYDSDTHQLHYCEYDT